MICQVTELLYSLLKTFGGAGGGFAAGINLGGITFGPGGFTPETVCTMILAGETATALPGGARALPGDSYGPAVRLDT